jgi:hypothetical protein
MLGLSCRFAIFHMGRKILSICMVFSLKSNSTPRLCTPYSSYVRCSPHHGGQNDKLKYLLLLYHQATLFPLPRHGRGGL